jgi:hypothetical protein
MLNQWVVPDIRIVNHKYVKSFRNPQQQRCNVFSSSRSSQFNPYEVLEVPRTASEKEIKIAYFKQAKRFHPDLNPNDSKANEKFQKIAMAYEILSDAKKRQEFDFTGGVRGQSAYSSQNNTQYTYTAQQRAEDMFRTVSEDAEIVKEALTSFIQDVQDEFTYAAESASKGDWKEVWEIVKVNKGIIFGVVVPLALIFRFPALVIMAGRGLLAVSQLFFFAMLREGKLPEVARWIWRKIVAVAHERNKRKRG